MKMMDTLSTFLGACEAGPVKNLILNWY